MSESNTVLGMFARYPEPGRTKTRLAASIGDEAAASLYTAFVCDLMARVPGLADSFVAAVTPATEQTQFWIENLLPKNGHVLFQPEGNLGERIYWFFDVCESAANRVVLIGSDSPDIPDEIIANAFTELDSHEVVIAPATDGGYVLIGFSVAPETLFEDVSWSSATTLQDTLLACQKRGFDVRLLQPWYDVDLEENLGTLGALQMMDQSPAALCPATSRVLRDL